METQIQKNRRGWDKFWAEVKLFSYSTLKKVHSLKLEALEHKLNWRNRKQLMAMKTMGRESRVLSEMTKGQYLSPMRYQFPTDSNLGCRDLPCSQHHQGACYSKLNLFWLVDNKNSYDFTWNLLTRVSDDRKMYPSERPRAKANSKKNLDDKEK